MAIDATVAGASANSYLTVAEADAFANSDLGASARDWLSATDDTKEAALIRATEEVDAEIGRVIASAVTGQALLFPRTVDRTAAGVLALPVRLKRATYLQAAYLVKNADAIDLAAGVRARGLSNFSNPDGVSGQVADDPSFGALHPRAKALLGEFTEGAVSVVIIPT